MDKSNTLLLGSSFKPEEDPCLPILLKEISMFTRKSDFVLAIVSGKCLITNSTEGSQCLQGRLTSANLGDSGFLVLTEKGANEEHMHVKYHSPQQEHQFGFPYQLGHHENADSVESAMLMTLPVRPSLAESTSLL